MVAAKSNFYIQAIKKPVAGNWFFYFGMYAYIFERIESFT